LLNELRNLMQLPRATGVPVMLYAASPSPHPAASSGEGVVETNGIDRTSARARLTSSVQGGAETSLSLGFLGGGLMLYLPKLSYLFLGVRKHRVTVSLRSNCS
jgi:hypothetical protein